MPKYDGKWAAERMQLRFAVSSVLRDVRGGMVNEEDVDRLHNFCMTALALASMVSRNTWEAAKVNAEVADMLHTRRK